MGIRMYHLYPPGPRKISIYLRHIPQPVEELLGFLEQVAELGHHLPLLRLHVQEDVIMETDTTHSSIM